MRSTNRKRALLISSSVILLCLTVIVGMTWALFTDTETVKHHLQAGELNAVLTRTEYKKTTLDDNGYLVEGAAVKETVNFTGTKTDNVFGLVKDEVIVPGSEFTATMNLANKGDVAFGYWIEIKCSDTEAAKELAQQVKITVTGDSGTPVSVAGGLTVGGEGKNNYLGVVETGKSTDFTVTVSFEDLDYDFQNGVLSSDNDLAKNQDLTFDLVVYAVQIPK